MAAELVLGEVQCPTKQDVPGCAVGMVGFDGDNPWLLAETEQTTFDRYGKWQVLPVDVTCGLQPHRTPDGTRVWFRGVERCASASERRSQRLRDGAGADVTGS